MEPASGPYVSITGPGALQEYTEGAALPVTLAVTARAGVRHVRLWLGEQEVVLTHEPWRHTFTVPLVGPEGGYGTLRAVAEDRAGQVSTQSLRQFRIRDSGAAAPVLTLATLPEGPLYTGGSTLVPQASATSATTVTHALQVGGEPVAGGVDYVLPTGPESAAVRLSATASGLGGTASGELAGTLAVFAGGPASRHALAGVEPAVDLALQGERLVVLRSNGGGRGTVEARSRADASAGPQRSLVGSPVAVAFAADRVAVALRTDGEGALELLSSADLTSVGRVALRREPTAVAGFRGGVVVGSDEGVEVRSLDGVLRARLPLGAVASLSVRGDRLYALAGGRVVAVDLSAPPAPRVVASADAAGTAVVAALGADGVCAAGTVLRCFTLADGALTQTAQRPLAQAAVSLKALGAWLLVGSDAGLTVLDARAEPRVAGFYPALKGPAVAAGGTAFAAKGVELARLGLRRGAGVPQVSLELPVAAAPGARLAVSATVTDEVEPLNTYTAELLVDGRMVEVLDGVLPASVDLPLAGASAQVTLRVRDLAGNVAMAQRTVSLVEDGVGPALLALDVPSEVLEGTELMVRPVPADPARVASVEVTLEAQAPVTFPAPAWAGGVRAPAVGADTQLTVTAVAVDAQGRRGPAAQAQVWVRDDAGPAPVVSALARQGTGPILEGARVQVLATTTPAAVREVRFRVEGVEQQQVVAAPYLASLLMPRGVGSRSVLVEAVAVDARGRESAPVGLSLLVVDDLQQPTLELALEPAAGRLSAGSLLVSTATSSDATGVARLEQQLQLDGVEVATGGAVLSYTVPASTPAGAVLRLVATAVDRAGNTRTQQATWTVVAPASPPAGTVVAAQFTGAEQLAVRGDRVYVRTATGFAVGNLTRGPVPSLTHVGTYTAPGRPLSMAVMNDLVLLAYGAAGLDVIDASSPASPVKVGNVATNLSVVVAYADRAEASAAPGFGYTVDLRDPARPVLSGPYGGGGLTLLSAHVDGFLYDNTGAVGTSYRSPADPLGSSTPHGVLVSESPTLAERDDDGIVMLTGRTLRLYDGRLNPHSTLTLPATGRVLRVVDGRTYVLDTSGRLRVVDVREKRALALVATEALDGRDLAISGGLLLAATPAGVELRRLPALPAGVAQSPTATLALTAPPLGATEYRGGVLVAAGTASIRHLNLSLPGQLVERAGNTSIPDARQVERVGHTVYFLTGTALQEGYEQADGSFFYSFNSGNNAYLNGLGAVTRFHVSPRRLWALGGGRVSTAVLPASAERASLLMQGGAVDVSGDERRAAVAHGAGGWSLVGLEPSGTLRRLATFQGAAVNAVALEGGLLVAGNAQGFTTWQVSGTEATARVQVPTAGPVVRARLYGRLAVLSEASAGVQLFDLSDADAPRLVATFPAGRADDAVLAGSDVVVADAFNGVLRFPLPRTQAAPSVRIISPADGAELRAGEGFFLAGAATGPGLDSVEVLLNGRELGPLDEREQRAVVRMPGELSPGSELTLRLRARSANGASALSEPVRVRVAPAQGAAPTVTLWNIAPNQTLASGQLADVQVRLENVTPPARVTVRYGGRVLGELAVPPGAQYATTTVQVPVVASTETGTLVADLTDGSGRGATSVIPITVAVPPMFTDPPPGMPPAVRVRPYVNCITSNYSYPYGPYTLSLSVDGVEVASRENLTPSGAQWMLHHCFELPESRLGTTATLALVVRDPAGRSLRTTRTYLVLPDGDPPVVSFPDSSRPQTFGNEGDHIQVYTYATDPDGDLASLRLLANGVELASTTTNDTLVVNYTLPRLSEMAGVTFTSVARDRRNRESTSTRIVQLLPNEPPSVQLEPAMSSLVSGYTEQFCVLGIDRGGIQSLELRLDGQPVETSPAACNLSNCTRRCATVAVPEGSSLSLTGTAVDALGASATGMRTYTLNANQPPTVSLSRLDYLVAGRQMLLTGTLSDERPPLAWAEFSSGGVSLSGRINTPSSTVSTSYTAAQPGTVVVELEAMDRVGASARSTRTVEVLPAGTGETCAMPVPLRQGETWVQMGDAPDAPQECGIGSTGAWLSLPFDGPVVSLTFYSPDVVGIRNGCGQAQSSCVWGTATVGPLAADARFFVRDWFFSGNKSIVLQSAVLGTGARCDPQSSTFTCGIGTCIPDEADVYRCLTQECSDGLDNDGDGLTDFPQEPGCRLLSDTSEVDPEPAAACSNGLDDDGDGRTDWPQDPGCGGAGTLTESGDGESCEAPAELQGVVTAVSLDDAASDSPNTCAPEGTPDRILSFRMPGAGTFRFTATDAHLALRNGCGPGSQQLRCATATITGTPGQGTPGDFSYNFPGAGTYQLVVSGNTDATVRVQGQINWMSTCDPTQPWFTCQQWTACLPSGGQMICRVASCIDGADNDGDGITDWPYEPGCDGLYDDQEQDPEPTPECGNGVDDDGDGYTDYPQDPGCSWAGGQLEGGDGESCYVPAELTGQTTLVPLAGASDDERLTCGTSLPDRVYGVNMPGAGLLRVVATHANVELRQVCNEAWSLGCSQSTGGGDGGTPTPGQISRWVDPANYWVVVSGEEDATLEVTGIITANNPCDPERPWFECEEGTTCRTAGGVTACLLEACRDGLDGDGDGYVDYPNDPGCDSPNDTDETDPEVSTVCHNGLDDDGDGHADYPQDPGCASAAGGAESGEGESCAAPAEPTSAITPVPLSTSTLDEFLCCGPDRVYGIRMPGPGTIQASAPGAAIYVRGACALGSSTRAASMDSVTSPLLGAGNYYLLVSGANDTTLQLSGQLSPGANCDQEQTWLTCSAGETCRLEGGVERCLPSRCRDGLDNDGDGRVDFPAEPGCTSPSDDDETDPETLPECANGVDDDGDGSTDFPADLDCYGAGNESERPVCANGVDDDGDGSTDFPGDLGCSSVSGSNEAFCHVPASGFIPRGLPIFISGSTSGQANNFTTTCGGSGQSSDRVYEWIAPVSGRYVFGTTSGSYDTVLHLRNLTCGGTQLACDDDAGPGTLSLLSADLTAGQAIAVIVDGYGGSSSGSYTLGIWKQTEAGLCTGGSDEDRDGLVDCGDGDCAADPACRSPLGGGQ
ncbi:MAG TPA: hypothetical protein VE153_11640 [Myxococcus sp.]|nr:hypothetical protein [Myxococcus sp.]